MLERERGIIFLHGLAGMSVGMLTTNNGVTMIMKTKQPEKKIKAIANDKRQHAK